MSDLQIDYLNSDNTLRNEGRYFLSQSRCSHCGGSHPTKKYFKQQRKDKGHKKSPFNSRNSKNERTEKNGQKPNTCFRCGLEDHSIENCPKLDTSDNKFHRNTENPKNCA